ncbi:MAG: ribonuclease E/G, partial [Paracoccaceae bacterium]|nr:ribonuclease E/G [Paracoccaceae bacterium]
MKGSVIALGVLGEQKAAARIVDGQLDDFLIDPADEGRLRPGAICRAVCDRPLKGQGGMMLRLAGGKTGFLRQGKGLRPGQGLLVQVTGFAEGGKATPVTQRILFKSRYAIVTPGAPGINISRSIRDEETRVALREIAEEIFGTGGDTGLIIRSAAADADEAAVSDDIQTMFQLSADVINEPLDEGPELLLDGPDAHELAWREWDVADVFADEETAFSDHAVMELLDELVSPRVELGASGFAFVEPTQALVAI